MIEKNMTTQLFMKNTLQNYLNLLKLPERYKSKLNSFVETMLPFIGKQD